MASHAEIIAELQKKQIHKKILNAGVDDIPDFVDGSKVTFHYRTTKCQEERTVLDDSKSINKPLELIIGKKFKLEIWEMLIKTMKTKEVAEFLVTDIRDTAVYPMVAKNLRDINKGHHHHSGGHCCGMMAEGGTGYPDLDQLMKQPAPLVFTLELLKFEAPEDFKKETWTMTAEEKLATVPKLREEGNTLYKNKDYDGAAEKYELALGLLEQLLMMEKPGDPEWVELDVQKTPLLLNYAQCKLLTGDYYTVITHTTDLLKKDHVSEADRVKALFRRGKAHAAVWDVKEAKDDLGKAADLDPTLTKAVAKEIKQLEERVKEKEQQEKVSLQGMFG